MANYYSSNKTRSYYSDMTERQKLYSIQMHVNKSVGAHKKKLRKSFRPVERAGKAVKSLKK
jgi:hypothetical protein